MSDLTSQFDVSDLAADQLCNFLPTELNDSDLEEIEEYEAQILEALSM